MKLKPNQDMIIYMIKRLSLRTFQMVEFCSAFHPASVFFFFLVSPTLDTEIKIVRVDVHR